MTSTTKEDNPNFWRVVDYDESYWNDYLAARPHYDRPFYDLVYAYHELNGGGKDLAHDVGTGPGQVAAELSKYFGEIVASDNNATHLAVAQHRLNTSLPSSQGVSLVQCAGELLDRKYPAGSADMIVAAECMPLLDAQRACEAFGTLLKPGGTLAMWFYGRPVFAEPDYAQDCQQILNSIIDTMMSPLIMNNPPQLQAGWKRGIDCMASFLDNIELDSRTWQCVERRKWNSQHPMSFNGPSTCDFEITPSSLIGKGETVIEIDDPSFWQRKWDIDGVKRFISILMPPFRKHKPDENMRRKYEELERAMGGKHAVRKITWPVVLILAARR